MRFLFAALAALLLTVPADSALADRHRGPGGFRGPAARAGITTVAAARRARDDAPVTLTGRIVKRMPGDDDDYLFRDRTGSIVVDIDRELFRGRVVTPRTRVRIFGEVDTHKFRPATVDVKWLEIL